MTSGKGALSLNSIADVWKNVLDRLRSQLSETTINTWFDEVEVVTMEDSAFVLHCSNSFKKSTIEARFMSHIKAALKDIFSSDLEVKILDDQQLSAYHGVAPDRPGSLLESDAFTFGTYVVGPQNKMAYAAARAVAEKPAEHYNPLFIYGDSGLGKTHLLYAIAHQVRSRQPDARIVYIKGDDFTNELIASIREGKNAEFREKYRQTTLLLVDDIQFIAGKKQTQEEFFHTFNTLYESGRQIVLTSDRPPREMTQLIGTEHCMTPPFCKIRRQSKTAAHTRRRAGDLSPAAAVDRLDAAKRHGKHYTDFPAPCQQKSAFSTKEPHSAAGCRFWARNSVISPTK